MRASVNAWKTRQHIFCNASTLFPMWPAASEVRGAASGQNVTLRRNRDGCQKKWTHEAALLQ
eukprot:6949500-Pyramimonas_sp.AAC.1